MFALVESGSITKFFSGNRGITIGDLQYSKQIFTLWTKAEREAIGIYEVEFDNTNKKDEQWYTNTNQSFAFAGGKITASYGSATAKAHADTKWTQSEIDNGDAPDGTSANDPKNDADGNQIVTFGLKTNAKNIAPNTPPKIVPLPPTKLAPPTTAAAITCNSKPLPARGIDAPNLDA